MKCWAPMMCGLILASIATSPSDAAVPLGTGFTYQGQLNQNGGPISGTVHFRFTLWDAAGSGSPPSGGNPIGGAQVVANVLVTGGLFTVQLNGSNEFGVNAFNGEARWLQIEVCTDAGCGSTTTLSPRQPLTATPYSLGPWRTTGSNLVYSRGSVGIGTTLPNASLHVASTADPVMILQDTGPTPTQTGYVSFWNVGGETGWIGYGTSGSAQFSISNARSGGDVALYAGVGGNIRLATDVQAMTVTSAGNVGVGTANPAAKLDVRGDIVLGSGGQYLATGAEENLRIVRGSVQYNGVPYLGCCFSVTRVSSGVYDVTFNTPFSAVPTITAACKEGYVEVAGFGPNSTPTVSGMRLLTDYFDSGWHDNEFYFIAVGPK